MPKHAMLSASGSHRWKNCPPSARLEEHLPDQETEYAAEGTLIHELAEAELSRRLLRWNERDYDNRMGVLCSSPQYSQEAYEVARHYVDYAEERYNAAGHEGEVAIEMHVDFSEFVPEGFGTADLIIIDAGRMEVIDLKGGKTPVTAEDNPQIRLYALGALEYYDYLYDIETITMTIVQPRLDSISSETMTREELLQWGDQLKPIAKMAWEGEGELQTGEHCRFCRAEATCRAREQEVMDDFTETRPEVHTLSDAELSEVLTKADESIRWLNKVKDYALQRALDGEGLPGWKLVEGRSRRQYIDEDQIAGRLLTAGYKTDNIYKPKELLGITAMEKLITKKTFKNLLEALVEKPPGKPTLVPADDKRPELDVTSDFE